MRRDWARAPQGIALPSIGRKGPAQADRTPITGSDGFQAPNSVWYLGEIPSLE